jgi:hypothetical protein
MSEKESGAEAASNANAPTSGADKAATSRERSLRERELAVEAREEVAGLRDPSVQQPSGSIPSAVQQLVECRCGYRIRGQACVRLTDRTVGLSSVMPNETFSRRHDVLPSFMNWICGCRQRANELSRSDAEQMDHASPDAASSAVQARTRRGRRTSWNDGAALRWGSSRHRTVIGLMDGRTARRWEAD